MSDLPIQLNEDNFFYKTRPLERLDLLNFGPEISKKNMDTNVVEDVPLVTEEVCKEVNLVAITEFYRLNKEETKVMMFLETETFPIYGFIRKNAKGNEWVKIYMPKGKKSLQQDGKDFRFQYLGKKSANYIFGLDEIRAKYNDGCEKAAEKFEKDLEDMKENPLDYSSEDMIKLKAKIEKNEFKFERICIATGGSDALNLKALGELVIWKNSETDHISDAVMEELLKMAKDVVNIPDLDATGRQMGTDIALEHIELKTFWMDEFTSRSSVKDFKDYVNTLKYLSYSKICAEVKKNLELSMPAKFWEESLNDKTRKISYVFNKVFGNYFLKLNGFLRVDDESRKDGYYFAKMTGHIVEELTNTQPIKDLFKNFLSARQKKVGRRKIPFELINAMINNARMSDADLASLHNRTLDFTDYDAYSQYFFFSNKIWKVSRTGTTEVKNFKNFVLKSQLIDELIYTSTSTRINPKNLNIEENQFKKDAAGNFEKDSYGNWIPEKKPYFTINNISEDAYDIQINSKDCDILNFLIQTSRVHWEAERTEYIRRGFKEEDFYEKTKFQIRSEYLSEEQNAEQVAHLVNKIFTIGYLGHRFKDSSRPWVPWAVDNAVSEDKVAEGGSGKGLFFGMFTYFMNVFVVDGKRDFEKDQFWLENVTKHTDLLFIDDVKRGFSMEPLYSLSTGNMEKNTKNVSKETISKRDSPKIASASNYSLRDMNGSSIRRRLLISFSDMYHSKNESREERNPTQDFGYTLYEDWDEKQWFTFINFICQSLSFYLNCNKKIEAPDNNILRRTWLSEMGDEFMAWADQYFPEIEGIEIPKFQAEDTCKRYAERENYPYLKKITPPAFKKKTIAWASYHGYDFVDRISKNMDVPVLEENGQYKLDNKGEKVTKRKTIEHIRLTKKAESDTMEDDEDIL